MIDIIAKIDCTGCKMCADTCPVQAISFKTDNEGFWYPSVDYKKCLKCKKCISTCPSLNKMFNSKTYEPTVYAAWAKDDIIRTTSTSGGCFYLLAEKMIQNSGYIAACIYSEDYKTAYHVISNSVDDLNKLKGSKYFQSDTAGIYKTVKKQLDEGKKVLFCGAPCHVGGLNSFLGKKDYENLITVDFICRGINSPKVFRRYVEDLEERYHAPVTRVHLKNKKKGWTHLGTYMEFANGKKYYRDRINDPWVNGFIVGNLFMRPCCSKCKYKERLRVADISIGDFWGLPSTTENLFKGISLVLTNTDKGEIYFSSIKDKLYVEPRTYEEASNGNGCLLNPAPMGEKRGEFFRRLDNEKYEPLIWDLIGKTKIDIFKEHTKYVVLNILRSIKHYGHS